jgi:hypothetical protein
VPHPKQISGLDSDQKTDNIMQTIISESMIKNLAYFLII